MCSSDVVGQWAKEFVSVLAHLSYYLIALDCLSTGRTRLLVGLVFMATEEGALGMYALLGDQLASC